MYRIRDAYRYLGYDIEDLKKKKCSGQAESRGTVHAVEMTGYIIIDLDSRRLWPAGQVWSDDDILCSYNILFSSTATGSCIYRRSPAPRGPAASMQMRNPFIKPPTYGKVLIPTRFRTSFLFSHQYEFKSVCDWVLNEFRRDTNRTRRVARLYCRRFTFCVRLSLTSYFPLRIG